MSDWDAEAAARAVLVAAERLGWRLATCESLTGGGVGAAITAVPGASNWYRGGLVTYASDLKVALAGVDADLVAERGVVNAEVAAAMALGVRHACGAEVGIATTGVAGPDPADGEAPGTVWLCVAAGNLDAPDDAALVRTRLARLAGDRTAVRAAAVEEALALTVSLLGDLGTASRFA